MKHSQLAVLNNLLYPALTVVLSSAPLAPAATLLAAWEFNAGDVSGSNVAASGGSAANTTGVLQADAAIVSGALSLDGTGDYLQFGNDVTDLRNLGVMTIAAWVQTGSAVSGFRRIVEHEDNFYGPWVDDSGAFQFTIHGTPGGDPDSRAVSTTAPMVGVWQHVAVTYQSGQPANIYINGVLEGTSANNQAAMPNTTETFQIGARRSGGTASNFWDGLIDDVGIWDEPLSLQEIELLAGVGTGGYLGRVSPSGAYGPGLQLAGEIIGDDLKFTWDSQTGKVYDLLSSLNLDSPPSTPWPPYDNGVDPVHENIAADPSGTNTLTIGLPADAVRFFALAEKDPPPPPPPAPLFEDDFEGADPGWSVGGASGDSPGTAWARGEPASPGPDPAFGGTRCAGTNLGTAYTANAMVTLTSPAFGIPVGGATLRFQQWIDTEDPPSGNFGTINLLDADNGDALLAVLASGLQGLGSDGWTAQGFDLPTAAWEKNIKLQFVFTSDGDADTRAGWYVDDIAVVLVEPEMEMQELFPADRFPNVVTATDGTILATWGRTSLLVRRSEDGGETWGAPITVGSGIQGGGTTVDETSGDILAFVETEHPPAPLTVYRSTDHGLTWQAQTTTINPDVNGNVPSMSMNEHGITLLRGSHPGRLLRPARWYDEGNGTAYYPEHYTTAIYSDDGGYTWNTSDPFPANGTGEAAVAELSDGSVYYNSRRHWAPAGENPRRRWTAESLDDGETWANLTMSEILPDGEQNRDYGLMGGLVRLPLAGRDILVFSNIESPSGRHHGTLWTSFDGGQTWPLKRLAYAGTFAYSSLDAGRPGTVGDGWIYLFFEGGPSGAGTMARFNLPWLLDGQLTGDGELPDWLP